MSDLLTVLVPSRGRPENLQRLMAAVEATAPGTCVYAWVDTDDPRRAEYRDLDWSTNDLWIGPRVRFGASVNALAMNVRKPYFAILGDDVLPETPDWAATLIESLGGSLGVAYGSDGLEGKHGWELPTHVVVPTEMYHRLGWIVLPTLRHLFADNVWRELGRGLGNFQYHPNVKLTHLHPWGGLAPTDETYAEANDARERSNDRDAFEEWRASPEGLVRDLERLRA